MRKLRIKTLSRSIFILLLVALNIGCDQLSKSIVRQEVSYNDNIKIFSDHFTLMKVENTGAFLSLGSALPTSIKFLFLTLFPILAIALATYWLLVKTRVPYLIVIGSCFLIGGGIGNLFDRLLYGSVTDFLHIDFGVFQTGVFNLADVSIMFGMTLIVIQAYILNNLNRSQLVDH
ncbi:MAG: lspA [Pedobacter sp.]|jgi:signal peptidase II|nr:lspA [Pedobacter sp.]